MRTEVFVSLGDTPRSGIAGPRGNWLFDDLSVCCPKCTDCTILRFQQQERRAAVSPNVHQHLLWSDFLIQAIHWIQSGISLCFGFAFSSSLTVRDPCPCLYAPEPTLSFVDKGLFNSFAPLKSGSFSYYWLVNHVPCHIWFTDISSESCLFPFLCS